VRVCARGAIRRAGRRRRRGRQARRRVRAKVRGARRGAPAFDVDGWARRFFAGVALALDAQAAEEAGAEPRMHVALGSAAAAAAASAGGVRRAGDAAAGA
jgi:hypothetical protein